MLSYTRQQAAKVLKISHKNINFPTTSVLQSRFSVCFRGKIWRNRVVKRRRRDYFKDENGVLPVYLTVFYSLDTVS